MFSFTENLKIKFFYSTSPIFRKYNHLTDSFYNYGGLCLQNSLSVLWFGFCLLLGLSVSWLVVMFGIGFVCLLVGSYVIMPFNSSGGVSVGLFD